METGANDVLVISPEDGGTDLLLPSHPDVILEMDLAEKRIVVRPLKYYGQ
jgi:ribosomal 30S subunit maturation factor RimM